MTPDVSQVGTPRRSHIVSIVVGFGILYSLTATWGYDANVDAIAAALPAWSVAEHGTLALDQFAGLNPWLVEGTFGVVSNRPPGAWAFALPAYYLAQAETFANDPATATAVIFTVAALVVLYVALCEIVSPTGALVSIVALGTATSTWQISADALWPHGPGQLWAALAVLALARNRAQLAGWALGAALLVRPVTAMSSAAIGLLEGWRSRSWKVVMQVAAPTSLALAVLLIYNRALFGQFSILGGYPDSITDQLTTQSVWEYVVNFTAFFLSPTNGILIWSPMMAIGVFGIFRAWGALPSWARSTAIAALVYLIVHARLNRASGGTPFGYRYPLEALVLAAPALAVGAARIWTSGRAGKLLTLVAIGVSVALQAALVLLLSCEPGLGTEMVCAFL